MGRPLTVLQVFAKGVNRLFNYVLDFELLIIRIAGFIPLYFIRWLIYLAAGVKIGKGAHLHMGTQFFYPANIEIGNDSIIGQNAFLDGRGKLKIGNHVDIASDVMIYNSKHDINAPDFHAVSSPVEVGDYVFIGPLERRRFSVNDSAFERYPLVYLVDKKKGQYRIYDVR